MRVVFMGTPEFAVPSLRALAGAHAAAEVQFRRAMNIMASVEGAGTKFSYLLDTFRTMGTIIGRTRKDGSKAFTAQIVIKKGGAIVHRESQSFDRKQAANAWVVKREAELKKPGGLERKEDPRLSAVSLRMRDKRALSNRQYLRRRGG